MRGRAVTPAQRAKILELLRMHPGKPYPEISKMMGGEVSKATISSVYVQNKGNLPKREVRISKLLSNEQVVEFEKSYNAGAKVGWLAKKYGVNRQTILKLAKKLKLAIRQPPTVKKLSAAQQAELGALYLSGGRIKDIAGHFSISPNAASDYVRMLGLVRKEKVPKMDKTNLRRMHSPLTEIVASGGRAVDAFRGRSKKIRVKAIGTAVERAKTRARIVRLALEGNGNREIADKTGLAINTVRRLRNVFQPDIDDAIAARERMKKWRKVFGEPRPRKMWGVRDFIRNKMYVGAVARCYELGAQSYIPDVVSQAVKHGQTGQALAIRDMIKEKGLKNTPTTSLFLKSDLWKRLESMKK